MCIFPHSSCPPPQFNDPLSPSRSFFYLESLYSYLSNFPTNTYKRKYLSQTAIFFESKHGVKRPPGRQHPSHRQPLFLNTTLKNRTVRLVSRSKYNTKTKIKNKPWTISRRIRDKRMGGVTYDRRKYSTGRMKKPHFSGSRLFSIFIKTALCVRLKHLFLFSVYFILANHRSFFVKGLP
jgi:hypothetical protein